mgnify:FL=1
MKSEFSFSNFVHWGQKETQFSQKMTLFRRPLDDRAALFIAKTALHMKVLSFPSTVQQLLGIYGRVSDGFFTMPPWLRLRKRPGLLGCWTLLVLLKRSLGFLMMEWVTASHLPPSRSVTPICCHARALPLSASLNRRRGVMVKTPTETRL